LRATISDPRQSALSAPASIGPQLD